jgi:hypothetical protein
LFRSSDEVLVLGITTRDLPSQLRPTRPLESAYLVQSLVEFRQLGSLTHHILVHHEWSLNLLVRLFTEEIKTVVDQCQVEVDTIICQEVSSVTGNLHTWGISC